MHRMDRSENPHDCVRGKRVVESFLSQLVCRMRAREVGSRGVASNCRGAHRANGQHEGELEVLQSPRGVGVLQHVNELAIGVTQFLGVHDLVSTDLHVISDKSH
eukprot:scaffold240392_cov33-Tisochrysis_lutea.AAC.7